VDARSEGVVSNLIVWLAVAAGSLLVVTVGVSLLMQPRGRPFGDDPHKEE
jgi:hypothetical protein